MRTVSQFVIKGITAVSLFLTSNLAFSQFEKDYILLDSYDNTSKALIQKIEDRYIIQSKRMEGEHPLLYEKYDQMTVQLISLIKKKFFIKDQLIETYINTVYQKLLDSNTFSCSPGDVLLHKDPTINALCYGEGTLILNLGLLTRIENEGELAFVLAHELAHYELDHVKQKRIQIMEDKLAGKAKNIVKKTMKGTVTISELEEMKGLIYDNSRMSRKAETEADSLGYIYFMNAGFDFNNAIQVLSKLDSMEQVNPPLGSKLFVPFDAPNYPFKKVWIKERLSIFKKEASDSFLFTKDSIVTHPDIPLRKEKLIKYHLSDTKVYPVVETWINSPAKLIYQTAEFETMNASFYAKQYDRALYYALKLEIDFPENAHLTRIIGRVLTDIYLSKEDETLSRYLPMYTIGYGEDFTLVNNLLHNISPIDLGEVAFNYLNRSSNFNAGVEEHYHLLWKICGLTGRTGVQEKVREAYKKRFKRGEFLSKMKTMHLMDHFFPIPKDRVIKFVGNTR